MVIERVRNTEHRAADIRNAYSNFKDFGRPRLLGFRTPLRQSCWRGLRAAPDYAILLIIRW
jgi:hypothetical protein